MLHLERLVLRGIARSDAVQVASGLETELRRLLVDSESVASLSASADIHRPIASRIRQPAKGGTVALGRAIARGIVQKGSR